MIGRGWRGLVAAMMIAVPGCGGSEATVEVSVGDRVREAYGDHPDAFGELWLPDRAGDGVSAPVVVLIHGGFWRDGFFLDLMDPLIPSLLDQGYAVWNIEYRRVGAGGGYPATFDDVANAIDHLAALANGASDLLDLDRVAVVGHSAGGHLATWAAGRSSLPSEAVGAAPVVTPALAVSQAGVLDLVGCARDGVGGTACPDLVGAEPDADPARYAQTSPTEMAPFDATVVAVHGDLDRIVPTTQSTTFVERATAAGMDASYVPVADADHFSNLDPLHPAWSAVLRALEQHLRSDS